MTDDLGAYARLYLRLRDDEKFAEVFSDDHHFAAYCRLLMNAEASWPASAHVPYGVRRSSLEKLAAVDLIELRPGHLYRVSGLDAERARRSAKATKASNARWSATSNAPSIPTASGDGMPIQAKPSKDEQSRDAPSSVRAPDPADVYWTLTGRYPTDKVLTWVDDLSASYGPEALIRALATTHAYDTSTSTLLGRTRDALAAEARALTLKEQSAVRQNLKERRTTPPVRDEAAIRAEIQRLMEPGAAA